jgi:aminoglycoside phosphotransferase (APT) family kinase protein
MPLILETDPAILGSPFLVMQRMPGAPRGDIFHPPASERLALDLAQQLALLHTLPVDEFEALGVPTEAFSRDQLRQGLAGFRETYGAIGLPSETIQTAFDWLEAAIPNVDGARALTHNDLGCHNFLIEGEDLSAILDWELAHIGNPAADLGYIRNFVGKMTSWERFIAAYEAAGGPKITPETVDFYTIWCGVRLFCLLMKARAGVAMGMVQDTEITYACAHFIPQQHHVLSSELRKILSEK